MKPYYSEAGIEIYHGDCREILPQLHDVDLVLTSPPYNMGVTSDGTLPAEDRWHYRKLPSGQRVGHYRKDARLNARGGHGAWLGNKLSEGYGECDDALPPSEYAELHRSVLSQCWDVLSETGAIFYNHKPRVLGLALWTPLELNPGLPLRQIVIWARNGGFNHSPTYFTPTHEWVLIFAKPDFRLVTGTQRSDVWQIPAESNTAHPAPFPLAFAKRAIEATPARLIIDPFCGSGTTLRAAKDLGRRAIGIEIEEKYCEIAARRLSQSVMNFGTAK